MHTFLWSTSSTPLCWRYPAVQYSTRHKFLSLNSIEVVLRRQHVHFYRPGLIPPRPLLSIVQLSSSVFYMLACFYECKHIRILILKHNLTTYIADRILQMLFSLGCTFTWSFSCSGSGKKITANWARTDVCNLMSGTLQWSIHWSDRSNLSTVSLKCHWNWSYAGGIYELNYDTPPVVSWFCLFHVANFSSVSMSGLQSMLKDSETKFP